MFKNIIQCLIVQFWFELLIFDYQLGLGALNISLVINKLSEKKSNFHYVPQS